MSLNNLIQEFLLEKGALKVGFATLETLKGGPPSVDLTYRMESARSAVSFALPMNREYIRAFLAKEDRSPHEEDNLSTNMRAQELSWDLAKIIKAEGQNARGLHANMKYRQELPNWQLEMLPDISHRYIAVRSGVGSFGWSGNVGIKGYGTAILLCTTLTEAELDPTDPISENEGFCDKCKLCTKSCAGEMMEEEKEMSVTLGGSPFTHAARKNYILCHLVCGGFTGLSKNGKWSTWSPGRFEIPDYRDENKLLQELIRASSLYTQRPAMPGGYRHVALAGTTTYMTCGNCQIVCFGDKKETAANLKILHSSGCVLQRPGGSLYALPSDEAAREFENMDPGRKNLYC